MDGDVNNEDRYCDYPLRLKPIEGLPAGSLARDIPPLRDVPLTADPRRQRSLQKVLDLERDRADQPLRVLDEGRSGVLSDEEYRRRLRRIVIPPSRANPVLRPLRLPNARDPRRTQACRRDHPDWVIGPATLVDNDLLPCEPETCNVLVIDRSDWPNETRCQVEVWPHECNVQRAHLDAQLLDGEDESLLIADNADRGDHEEEVLECDENGEALRFYHADVETPMLGDEDDDVIVDAVLDEDTQDPSTARERKLSGGEMTIRVKDERWLMRPMPVDDDENVDLVDLCSDEEIDVKPEPPHEGYREDAMREILEVVTLDDDDDDDDDDDIVEITSTVQPCVLNVSSEAEDEVQPVIPISQPRLEANHTEASRNATLAARQPDDITHDDSENRVTGDDTECATSLRDLRVKTPIEQDPPEWAAVPLVPIARSACTELVPVYVRDYGHRSAEREPHRGSSNLNDDAEMREVNACDLNAMAAAAALKLAPLALTIPRLCADDEMSGEFVSSQRLELRLDVGGSAALLERWTEPRPSCSAAAVWTGCDKLRRDRRWRPYEGGRMDAAPARRQQQPQCERELELLRDFFKLAVSWASISVIIGNHNLSLRCLLQAHASAKRSADFWRARNDHWKTNKNQLSIKEIPQVENYDSSYNNDERSLCSYDGDEEEINDYEELILPEYDDEVSYNSDSSLIVSKMKSTSTNFNSASSSSLQVNLNIEQNLFTSKVLKASDSQFSKNNIKFKKRHSVPPVASQYQAKRSRSYSDASSEQEVTSSLKLTLKKDHISNQYRISSPDDQLTVSDNILKLVDSDSSEDNTDYASRNYAMGEPIFSKNKTLTNNDFESADSISKLKVHINKAVPELELNDTRPVNMPMNRNNLENSLSPFLKSKLKRNSKDDVEVESKRQKITDDSVAVKINLNITVNSVLESKSQKQQPVEVMSSNDNMKQLLPKSRTNICSTSDFSSCNESEDENRTAQKLNSKISIPKNSYVKSLKKNTDSVLPAHESLQVDHNCNIEKLILTTNRMSSNSEGGVKISKRKHPHNLTINGNLKLVFKNLFGEGSDMSETEEEILKQKTSKSKEHKKEQFLTNNVVASVDKNQSKNNSFVVGNTKQNKSKLKDFNGDSLKFPAIKNIEEVNCDINRRAEISSVVNNVKLTMKLPENPTFISTNTNIQKSILGKNHHSKQTISSTRDIEELIDVSEKNRESEEDSSYTNQSEQREKSHSEETNIGNIDETIENENCISNEESNTNDADINSSQQSNQHEKNTRGEEINTCIIAPNNPKQNEKRIGSEDLNTNDADRNISKQSDQNKKNTSSEEINTGIVDQIIPNQIESEKNVGNKETNIHNTDRNIPKQLDENILSSAEANSLVTERNISNQNDHLNESCDTRETGSEKNIPKQISQLQKSCSTEKIDSPTDKNILTQTEEFEKRSIIEESYVSNDFSSKDQMMPDKSQMYEQVDLEGGDFDFVTSIHKIKNSNAYSDDEYNDYSDFDVEYDGTNNVNYGSDVEFIDSYKNPTNNNHLHTDLVHEQDYKEHNLNKLPSFYNEDVTNFVKKDVIDVDDEDCVILNDFGSVSKSKNKSNFNADKSVKSEIIIDLDSDEEVIEEVIEEIHIEASSNILPNEVISETRESIPNNIINNLNIEDTNEVDQSTETNDHIENAVEKTVPEESLDVLKCGLSSSPSKEVESVTLTHKENGAPSKASLDANRIPETSDTEVRNTSEVSLNPTQDRVSINSFINQLIEDALNPSERFTDSAAPDKSFTDFSENALNQNNESSNSIIADALEDILDLNLRSESPNNLVIDETAGTDDTDIPNHLPSEFDKSLSNEIRNSVYSPNNVNSGIIDNTVAAVTSSVDELKLQRPRFSGNISNDLSNPSILQEFNLTKEIVAPEDIKNEPITSDDNGMEQQMCENLLEELKNNSNNLEEQSSVSIKVTEASEVVINETDSNSIPFSNIIVEVTVDNSTKSPEESTDWMDVNDLRNIAGPFKCRDINELLEKPVTKKPETNAVEDSNLNVQVTTLSESPSSTTITSTITSSNSTQNTVPVQNINSSSQINYPNNLIFGNNFLQSNVPEPTYIESRPINALESMINQVIPFQECVPQQMHQPLFNLVNPTVLPQYIPQTYIITPEQNNQNLSQENPQIFTSAVSNNTENQNLPLANQQPFAPTNSNSVQKIFASSMFTNVFAQKSNNPSAFSESPVYRSNANNSSGVPPELDTIYTLPLPPSKYLNLPAPLSITPQDTETSIFNNVMLFRRKLLHKIEVALGFVRTILQNDLEIYKDALIKKQSLTKDVWSFHLAILTIMKCLHAIYETTTSRNYAIIMKAVTNSLNHSETPEMKTAVTIEQLFSWNALMGKSGYNFTKPKDFANVIVIELQQLQNPNQSGKIISAKQKIQLRSQVQQYVKLCKTHQKEVSSSRPNYNLEIKKMYQNSSVTIRPVNIATVSNNPTSHNSLQKSSLNDTEKKQSTTSNVTVQKIIDNTCTNNTDITITPVRSEKKEANYASILANLNPTCLKCQKTSDIVCSNCLSVAYCSRECQYNHWKEIHYENCEKHKI